MAHANDCIIYKTRKRKHILPMGYGILRRRKESNLVISLKVRNSLLMVAIIKGCREKKDPPTVAPCNRISLDMRGDV